MSVESAVGPLVGEATPRPRARGWRGRFDPWLVVLVAPGLILFGLFMLWPLVNAFANSVFRWDGLSPRVFVGLDNYERMLTSPEVGAATIHILIYAAGTAVAKIVLAFAIALLVGRAFRGVAIVRSVLFVPVLMSFVAVGVLWSFVLNPNQGLLNRSLGLLGLPDNIGWLGEPQTALFSIMAVDVWKWLGYHVILLVAGLQAVRADLYEAARMDGANRFQLFRHVTLPAMRTMIALNFIIAIGGALNVFDLVYVMTKGGPYGSTETLMTLMYREAFGVQHYGPASALAVLLFVGVALVTFVQIRLLRSDYTN